MTKNVFVLFAAMLFLFGISSALVDLVPPVFVSVSPVDNYNTSNDTPTFEFTVTDDVASTLNCSIWTTSGLRGTNDSVQNDTLTSIVANQSFGVYGEVQWWVNCSDGINYNSSQPRMLYFDTLAPYIDTTTALFSKNPVNVSETGINFSVLITGSTPPNFSISANVTINGTTYPLTYSETDGLFYNDSIVAPSFIGDFEANISAENLVGSSSSEIGDYNLTVVDEVAPVFVSVAPVDNYNTSNDTPTFEFTVSDNYASTLNCSIWSTSGLRGTNDSVQNGTLTSIVANESFGVYGGVQWWVNCSDGFNYNSSQPRMLYFDTLQPYIYTNSSFFSPIVANGSESGINFSVMITGSTPPNFSISANVTINGTTYPLTYSETDGLFYNDSIVAPAHIGNYSANISAENLVGSMSSEIGDYNLTVVDNIPANITSIVITDPDIFYSNFTGNDIIHVNATVDGTGTDVQYVVAVLSNGTHTTDSVALAFNNTTSMWVGAIDINNLTINSTPFVIVPNPVSAFQLILSAADEGGIQTHSNEIWPPIYDPTVIIHDLGSLQTAYQTTCFREGPLSTNMTEILNFNDVNFVKEIQINGSAYCANLTFGYPQALPWGDTFQTVALFNFTSVDMSTPESAQAVASAMAGAINVAIGMPHTFEGSRIYINSSNVQALNTTASITLYGLPFSSEPNVTYDLGGTNGAIIVWSQGGFDATYNSSIGNLTITVGNFSGYNFSDEVAPTISIGAPVLGTNFANEPMINITANGTGSEISYLYFTLNGVTYAYNYSNPATNKANCTQASNGSEVLNCILYNVSLGYGTYTLSVNALDFFNNPAVSSLIVVSSPASATAPVNASNITNASIEIQYNSSGGANLATLTIPDNTTITTPSGYLPGFIYVYGFNATTGDLAASNSTPFSLLTMFLGPSGTTFSPNITVSINYSNLSSAAQSQVEAALAAGYMRIKKCDDTGGNCVTLMPSAYDTTLNIINVSISGFSTLGLYDTTPAPAPTPSYSGGSSTGGGSISRSSTIPTGAKETPVQAPTTQPETPTQPTAPTQPITTPSAPKQPEQPFGGMKLPSVPVQEQMPAPAAVQPAPQAPTPAPAGGFELGGIATLLGVVVVVALIGGAAIYFGTKKK